MSETLESYCEYYKRPCTVSDGLCSECGERLIEPASGATEESPKTKGMTNGKQSKSELIIEFTVRATNTLKYKEVVIGTYEFRCEPTGEPIRFVKRLGNNVGMSKDMNAVFLSSIEIQPRMHEAKGENL